MGLMWGCSDPTVDVLRPSDQFQYSLFGALNVAADTQVIRIEPLGDSTQIGAPRRLGATVVLENLDTGTNIPLNDSLSTFGNEPIVVHNLWTDHSIHPSTAYRITVQRDGTPVTTATTTTPARPPDLTHTAFPDTALRLPCVFPTDPNNQRKPENTFTITAQNVDRVAAAEVIYPIPRAGSRANRTFNHSDGIEKTDDLFVISIFYRQDLVLLNPDPPPPDAMTRECASRTHFARPYVLVAVAAGGPGWPKWRGVSLDELARPDSFSNVEGGHGFVGAIYSDTVRVPLQDRE